MNSATLVEDPAALQARIRERVARSERGFAESKSPAMKELEKLERKQQRERRQAQAHEQAPQPVQEAVQEAAPAPTPAPESVKPVELKAAPTSDGEPWGKLQAVVVPLSGYEGVVVWYRTNNQLGTIRNIPESSDKAAFAQWCGRFVKRVDWPYKVEPPPIDTVEGLQTWEDEYQDLLLWIIAEGYRTAREMAAGPRFQGDA